MNSKRVVLTGVSRGLGLAMTEGFIALGHTVCGWPVRPRRSSNYGGDSVRPTRSKPWTWATMPRWPPGRRRAGRRRAPDLLVNNAALMNRTAPLWQAPAEEFNRLLAVNIGGTASVIRRFLPAMIACGRGVVVNFSSGWGRCGGRGLRPIARPSGPSRAFRSRWRKSAARVGRGGANPGTHRTAMLRSCWETTPGPTRTLRPGPAAVPYLLQLGPGDNGAPREVPDA